MSIMGPEPGHCVACEFKKEPLHRAPYGPVCTECLKSERPPFDTLSLAAWQGWRRGRGKPEEWNPREAEDTPDNYDDAIRALEDARHSLHQALGLLREVHATGRTADWMARLAAFVKRVPG